MAVLQPLYISQARYTPGIDRKLLAGIFDTTSAGALMTGVLPPTDHFRASSSGVTVSVSAGFCVIPDSPSQNTDSPGVYFCSIDATAEVATAATSGIALSTPGTYKIYAEVNEATKSVIKAEISATNVAKITTATAHGYTVGQTVLINGVNNDYNGSYVITAVTTSSPHTFSFTKTGVVGTPATVDPATGTSSVPFAIKYAASYPTGTAEFIPIATAVSNGSSITLTDERTFVSSRSGIQLYRSTTANGTATTREAGSGRLAYDLDTNKLYAYVNSAWKLLVDGTTGHHDATSVSDGSDSALHHTLGTGTFQAAKGDHGHTAFTSAYGAITNSSYVDATVPANTTVLDEAWSGKSAAGTTFTTSASGRVIANMSALIYTYNTDKTSILSVRVGTGSTINGGTAVLSQSSGGKNSIRMEGGSTANIAVRTGVSFALSLSPNTVYNACFYYYNNDTIAVPINDAYIEFIPIP